MNSKIAKKIRQYAQRDYYDLFSGLLRLPLWERVKIALKIVFKHG
jgi:hypothetical protein